ncbi:reverse ribonuclease integrase, partial [Lasius niger]
MHNMKAWIYDLPKSDLAEFAARQGIDTTGTLDDLRKRVRAYLDAHPEVTADIEPTARAGTSTDAFADARDTPRTPITLIVPQPRLTGPGLDDAKLINQMRKWGCQFDGRDPLFFLERVDELKTAYGFPDGQILKGLPELMKGDALLWHRNNREDWHSWGNFERAFRAQYLPRRYQAALRREAADRRQKPGEKFAKYATDLLILMRRAGGFTRGEQLDRLYDNMNPEYKLYVRYDEAASLAELQARASEYEEIEQQRRDTRKADRTDAARPAVAAAYNRTECCWRLRARRGPHEGLSSAAGKRIAGRGHGDRKQYPEPRISYTPRPHLDIQVHNRRYSALLNTGSEISFVNDQTAEQLRQEGCSIQAHEEQIQLANGAAAEMAGIVTLPVRINRQLYRHEFAVLPSLESQVLIGADLWERTGIHIPPPPWRPKNRAAPRCGVTGGLTTCTQREQRQLQGFLRTELAKFEAVRGPTTLAQHHIRLRDTAPIKQRYRPRNPAMQAIIDREVEDMEAAGVIEPSHSAWSSPVVIVKKKDGKHRFCIDFRRVNDVTVKDAYLLPQVTATLDKLRGARYLTTLDLKNGYWQIPLEPDSRPITAFTIPGRGLFQFTVMLFGLHSAPATFQRLLDSVLGPALEPHVFVYLDDIIIISRTFEEHIELLAEVFRRLREARLRLNPEKCRFCVGQLKYLGHVIDRNGIRTDPEKVSAVANWPEPTSVEQVRQFLGMASWYRRFIADFSKIAAPLTKLTKKHARWSWGETENEVFHVLKWTLIFAPVLACPDFSRPFVLQTDASTNGLGAVLTQNYDEGERVIAYASRTLNGAEKNYSATELECLAVVWGIRRMKGYLEGYRFTVITDHQSLKWLQRLEAPTGRLARWLFELQQYDFEVKYRRGALNRVA